MISSANPSLRQEMKIVAMVEVEAGHSEKTSGVMWAVAGQQSRLPSGTMRKLSR